MKVNLVKRSIGLMLVVLFALCYVPAFAACPNGSKSPACSNCSKTPECYLLQMSRLNVVVRDLHKIEKHTPYVEDQIYIIKHATDVLNVLRLPKRWESFLATMIQSCKDADFELCFGSQAAAMVIIKQVHNNLDDICIDLMGKKVTCN